MIRPYIIGAIEEVEAKGGDSHVEVGTALPALGKVAEGKRKALPATFLVKLGFSVLKDISLSKILTLEEASEHLLLSRCRSNCSIRGDTSDFGVLHATGDEGEDGVELPHGLLETSKSTTPEPELIFFLRLLPLSFPTFTLRLCESEGISEFSTDEDFDGKSEFVSDGFQKDLQLGWSVPIARRIPPRTHSGTSHFFSNYVKRSMH
ncbi:hypothetical protein ACJIZ3_014873 [Penstemon smallii]|uniref:Uncharacterized protein n=1 Tax=Penstemon smallii TaxID=265156 RepID=A0ABD3RKV3_9LAMI